MKVLLVSPKDPDKPGKLKLLLGGENTFTRNLLNHPPKGVKYYHYQQALKEGKISYAKWQNFPSFLMKLRLLPLDVGFLSFKIKAKFDLIHCHGYCLKLENYRGPVILSDSSSNLLFLKDYLGWSEKRIRFSYRLRKFLMQTFQAYDPNLNLNQAKKLIVWSKFAKKIHLQLGADRQKITVIPPGLPKTRLLKKPHRGINILFVGIWFERKGGPLLLKAYQNLKKRYPQIKLTLVGALPRNLKLPPDTYQRDYLPREVLIREVFPNADILVLIPPIAEGYGLVVLEAASFGIPSIVSSVYALPEMVEDGKTGFVIQPNNLPQLIDKLEILINNNSCREKIGKAAQEKFNQEFWLQKTNQKLLRIYQEAIKTIG